MTVSAVVLNLAARRVDVDVRGDLDAAELGRLTDETLALIGAHDVFNVLVNLHAMNSAPPASALQRLPEYYAARGIDRRMRIAIVLPPRGDAQGLSRFYKLAARRQSYQVDAFDSIDAAVEWLQR